MGPLLPAQIDAFLATLQAERGRSANTIAAYRNDLTQFSTYVQSNMPLQSAEAGDDAPLDGTIVEEWFRTLTGNGYAPATVARKQAAVSSFCRWLTEQSALADLPRKAGVGTALNHSIPPALDGTQVDALLAHATKCRSPQCLRDIALLHLLVGMGCTASKLVALDMAHLQLEATPPIVRIGSAAKRLPPAVAGAVAAYLAEGRDHLAAHGEEDALFLNHRGKRLTRQGLWLIVKRRAEEAGLEVEVTPQLLRQSFALLQIEKGVEPKRFAEQMGTSQRRSAQDYRKMAKRAKSSSIVVDGTRTDS
jgi:integrase/recombinase XerD